MVDAVSIQMFAVVCHIVFAIADVIRAVHRSVFLVFRCRLRRPFVVASGSVTLYLVTNFKPGYRPGFRHAKCPHACAILRPLVFSFSDFFSRIDAFTFFVRTQIYRCRREIHGVLPRCIGEGRLRRYVLVHFAAHACTTIV